MKKLLLVIVGFCTFTVAVAKLDTTIDVDDTSSTFVLQKAAPSSLSTLTPYQVCVMNCLNTYYPWQERQLQRCLANCGVQ